MVTPQLRFQPIRSHFVWGNHGLCCKYQQIESQLYPEPSPAGDGSMPSHWTRCWRRDVTGFVSTVGLATFIGSTLCWCHPSPESRRFTTRLRLDIIHLRSGENRISCFHGAISYEIKRALLKYLKGTEYTKCIQWRFYYLKFEIQLWWIQISLNIHSLREVILIGYLIYLYTH